TRSWFALGVAGLTCVEHVSERTHAPAQIGGDGLLAKAQTYRDLSARKVVNAAHDDEIAVFRRQAVHRDLQAAKFFACDGAALLVRCVDGRAQRIQIGNGLDRHNVVPTHSADQKVARRGENERLRILGEALEGPVKYLQIYVM